MRAIRYSSYPPELRKFVASVERNAQAAGPSDTLARIFGRLGGLLLS
jgi:hypothetical protein